MLDACQPGDDGFLTENIYLGLSAELETAEMTPNAIFMDKIFLGISKCCHKTLPYSIRAF